jgi:integrase/recombinase XerD
MTDLNLLAPWVKRFLADYLVTVRSVARSTQLSYRDTLARLIRYAAVELRTRPDLLKLDDISRDLINRFLPTATTGKAVGARIVNQRLAAIHSFARFVSEYGPEHLEWSGCGVS